MWWLLPVSVPLFVGFLLLRPVLRPASTLESTAPPHCDFIYAQAQYT
jgi:hypothetical protein